MEISQKVTTGDYEVITSGQIIAFRNGTIELSKGEDAIKINFKFLEDETNKPRIDGNVISNKEITMTFHGFDKSVLGSGNIAPILLGKFAGRELLFSYRVTSLDDKTLRTFFYTFYAK